MIVYCTAIYVIKKGTSHTHTQKHKALVATQTHSRLRSKVAGRVVSSGVTWCPRDWMCWGVCSWKWTHGCRWLPMKHTLILHPPPIICLCPFTIWLWASWRLFFFTFWIYFSCLIEPGHHLTNDSPFASSPPSTLVPTSGHHFSQLGFREFNCF